MTQSIIVYRSPAEAAFWESGMASTLAISMIITVPVAIICHMLFRFLILKLFTNWPNYKRVNFADNTTLGVSIATFVMSMIYFSIY